tara:strand:+ start:122 stop:481 length:360 start_codon:yes stop_codon:yes gene_type:complete
MEISTRFNKFYHSRILNDMFLKANQIVFCEIKDTRTGKNFILKKYEEYSDVEELKQLLKILNFNYKVDKKNDKKISTKDIDNKELLAHIEWVIKLCAENDIMLPMVQEEWDLMIQTYNR